MRRVSDTSRAREFILENKDKYDFKQMTEKVLEMTSNLSVRSVKTLIVRTLDTSLKTFIPPTGKRSVAAQDYIKENIDKASKEDIVGYIIKNMRISDFTAVKLYELIELELQAEEKEKQKELEALNRFKGKQRRFFQIDDSKLYRGFF